MYTYTDYCADRAIVAIQYMEGMIDWFEARLRMANLFRKYNSRPLY